MSDREILSEIFLVAHSQTQPEDKALLALRATWVCRYWKSTARNHSPLWAVITISRVDCLEHFIARSKEAKLTIALRKINMPESDIWSPILGAIRRVAYFALVPKKPDALMALSGSLEPDGSDTATLALRILELDHVDILELEFALNPIHTLILTTCAFFWERSFGMSTTLTNLDIRYPTIRVAYTDILLQLQNSPCIETVHLVEALTLPLQHTPTIHEPVTLPALRILDLSEGEANWMNAVLQMVRLLDLPGIQELQFWTEHCAMNINLIPQLLYAAHTACQDFMITYASILTHAESWSQISIANDQDPSYDSSITLRIDNAYDGSVFTIAMNHLTFQDVEYFHIGHYENGISTDRWIEAVGGPNSHVSILVLQFDAIDEFPGFAQDQFPQLKELIFYTEAESSEKIAIPMHIIQSGRQYTKLRRVVFCGEDEWDRSDEAIELLKKIGCKIRFKKGDYIADYYEEERYVRLN
ncbi:hypothetical protein BDN72DRAFT_864469 [Pluteus cervinus]|uniref:Uncharacterized protein n=1 Tax=Pluteus cervinus TaxID=181527 RepID=A0ACD3A4K0_9AGAR|nr:hypothetical protein BDN72DRAFT_864469 [Pluteus cervinus]